MPATRRFDWLFRAQTTDVQLPLPAVARIADVLATLPAVERSALALCELGGLDTQEIALRLGTDPVVVRRLLFRARESVRAQAARECVGPADVLPFQDLWQAGAPVSGLRASSDPQSPAPA